MATHRFVSLSRLVLLNILSPIILHIKTVYGQFDPVSEAPIHYSKLNQLDSFRSARLAQVNSSIRAFFLFPVCIFVYNLIENVVILYLNDFDYFNRPIPELFYHKTFPESFWSESDLIWLSIVLCSLVIFFNLWHYPWLDDRFHMYFVQNGLEMKRLIVNGKTWDQTNADEIYRFHRSNQLYRKVFIVYCYVFFEGYFQYNLWQKGTTGFRYYFLVVYLLIILFYTVFSVLLLFYHFFIASKYIIIKQRYLIKEFDEIISKMADRSTLRKKSNFYELYSKFHSVNQQLVYQCKEIRGCNRFWSIYLTAQFTSNIFCVGYLAYCLLFIEGTFDQKIYYAFFGLELVCLVFAIITRGSIIDSNNDLAYSRNVKCCILFQSNYNISPRLLANIETIATNPNLSRNCFRLKNSYRLDSTAFQMAFFIMTTFFMNICRKAQLHHVSL